MSEIIDIRNFGGIIPKIDPKMLPPANAQIAVNVKLWNADLQAVKAPKLTALTTKSGTIQAFYRLNYQGGDYWLHWAYDVDAVRSPLAGDTQKRLYYTGEGEPRVTDAEMASQKTDTVNGTNIYPGGYGEAVSTDYPRAFYALGIPAPIMAPVLGTPSGGAGTDETRSYVMTFVSAWGEESAPSPPSVVATGKPNGTWPLTQLDVAPLNTGVIIAATATATVTTVYTSAAHWLRAAHKIVIAAVVGMTDLNGTWRVNTVNCVEYNTTFRARSANVATLTLNSVAGLAVGQTIVVTGVGGAGYNATATITAVSTTAKTITYANVGGNEASTADITGKVTMSSFTILKAAGAAYVSGGTWTRAAPYNVGNATKRIYRLLTGTNGEDFKFVDEIPVATTSYSDTKLATDLGETLPTADPSVVGSAWDLPPGDMIGIVSMPGGFLAGFREDGNEVCFSEPGYPYAWPIRYRQTTDFPIVGLGTWGSNLSALTTAVPYRMSGFAPDSLSVARGEEVYPCVSKRSIVSGSSFGVMFATDRGLAADNAGSVNALVDTHGTKLLTDKFFDRKKWQELVVADSMFAMEFDGRYLGFWPIDSTVGGGIIFDPRDPTGGITNNNFVVQGTWYDPETGIAYVVDDEGIKEWDGDDANKQTYEWKSRKYILPMPLEFKAARVDNDPDGTASEAAAIAASNAAITAANAIIIATMPVGVAKVDPVGGSIGDDAIADLAVIEDYLGATMSLTPDALTFELWGDGALWYSTPVLDSDPFRIPDGKKHATIEIRLLGNVKTQAVQIAPTMGQLAAI